MSVITWHPGWYGARLHAVKDLKHPLQGTGSARAVCGTDVYAEDANGWIKTQLAKGIPHCKRCEKSLPPTDE